MRSRVREMSWNVSGVGVNAIIGRALRRLVRLYQLTLSPYIGRQCRFYPSCSHYADEAIANHGPLTGSILACRRLAKCHPFHAGGIDLVPDPKES